MRRSTTAVRLGPEARRPVDAEAGERGAEREGHLSMVAACEREHECPTGARRNHSFSMLRSGDNRTGSRRTALVLHHTATGTAPVGPPSGTIDLMPVAAGFEPLA